MLVCCCCKTNDVMRLYCYTEGVMAERKKRSKAASFYKDMTAALLQAVRWMTSPQQQPWDTAFHCVCVCLRQSCLCEVTVCALLCVWAETVVHCYVVVSCNGIWMRLWKRNAANIQTFHTRDVCNPDWWAFNPRWTSIGVSHHCETSLTNQRIIHQHDDMIKEQVSL